MWADTGEPLNAEAIDCLMAEHGKGITCVCFMGGDAAPHEVVNLAAYIHRNYPQLKVAWYSGRQYIPPNVDKQQFDYIKVGPYIAHLGPLQSDLCNQHMFKRQTDGSFLDITARFRRSSFLSPTQATLS